MSSNPLFHYAFPVHDLEQARAFYGQKLGCSEGRSSDHWIDFNLYGHQIVAHLITDVLPSKATNPVDGDAVPIPHFGLILDWDDWHALANRLQRMETEFVIEPHVRFRGEIGEQATMFFRDPSGNALEFKAFQDPSQVFAKD